MRLLLVNSQGADLAGGGSGQYVADLATGLAARGHGVHVLAAFPVALDGARDTTVLHKRHWRESRTRRWRNHAGDLTSHPGRTVEAAVATANPDLVHTCNLPGISTGVWETVRRQELPLVHTLLDYHLLCPRTSLTRRDGSPCCPHPRFCAVRTRRLARWAPAVSHVISGSEHVWAREGHLFPRGEVTIARVPLAPATAQRLDASSVPTVVGYVGGLDPVKGIRELLAAAPELRRLGLRVRIAGDGRMRGEVEAAGVDIEYVGHVEGAAKVAFISETDIAIVPSTWEEPWGPNYVVAEWVSAARPVLVSTRGGLAEARALPGVMTIEPTSAGIVAGVRELAEAGAWQRLVSGLLPVADNADLDRWLDQHEATYERALAARASSTL